MDPVTKSWMFYNWIEDTSDKYELSKHNAYVGASFVNPEAVKKVIDSSNKHVSSEEEFEESFDMVRQGENNEIVKQINDFMNQFKNSKQPDDNDSKIENKEAFSSRRKIIK